MTTGPLKAIAGAQDRPLVIGDIEIPCYVLEDETRVLTQGAFLRALDRSRTPKAGTGSLAKRDALPFFLSAGNLTGYVSDDLRDLMKPIVFRSELGQRAVGFKAESLPQVCDVYLRARSDGTLLPAQEHIAYRAEILVRGLATVGIIALVDEVTGYQRVRDEQALGKILDKFIAEHLQPWTKTFPYEFYEGIFRLKGWDGPTGEARPQVIGHYTNDIVYKRLAPGVLQELRRLNPTSPTGSRRSKHHQWFTPDLGNPKLKEHLAAVIALMKAAPDWERFMRSLDRALPALDKNLPLLFDD